MINLFKFYLLFLLKMLLNRIKINCPKYRPLFFPIGYSTYHNYARFEQLKKVQKHQVKQEQKKEENGK